MNTETKIQNIKSWAEADRPREKFLQKGASVLSDAELIAILIGSGSRTLSAVDLAKLILKKADNELSKLAKLSIKDLMKQKGVGEAKAVSIAAALELGRRRKEYEPVERMQIKTSVQTYNHMKPYLFDLQHEESWIILLDTNLSVLKTIKITVGGVSTTIIDLKIIFKHALEHLASNIILVHNHPSGNLSPSQEDIVVTERLKNAAKTLDIKFIDHLIFANEGYYSFSDNN